MDHKPKASPDSSIPSNMLSDGIIGPDRKMDAIAVNCIQTNKQGRNSPLEDAVKQNDFILDNIYLFLNNPVWNYVYFYFLKLNHDEKTYHYRTNIFTIYDKP